MLDSINHTTIRLLRNLISAVEMFNFYYYVRNVVMYGISYTCNSAPKFVYHYQWFINFNAWRYFTLRRRRHMINNCKKNSRLVHHENATFIK